MVIAATAALIVSRLGAVGSVPVAFTKDVIFEGDQATQMAMNTPGMMNGDVALDVVTSTSEGMVVLRQGTINTILPPTSVPSGIFATEPITGIGGTTVYYARANDCEVHDFNGDGDLDIAVFITQFSGGTFSDQRLVIFENTGYGNNWYIKEIYQNTSVMKFSHDLELADFDQDGNVDICLNYEDHSDSLKTKADIFWNPGTWLSSWSRTTVGTIGAATKGEWGLAAGDIDGDGHPDIVAHNGIFTSNSPSSQGASWSSQVYDSDQNPSTIFLADVNDDGYVDIATAEGHAHRDGRGDVYVHFQSTTNTFPLSHKLLLHAGRGVDPTPDNGSYDVPDDDDRLNLPEGIVGQDYDADGKIECWFYPEFGDFDWNSTSGGHFWECRIDFSASGGAIPYGVASGFPNEIDTDNRIGHQVLLGDVDNDGDSDLLLHNVGATNSGIESFVIFYH